MTKTLATMAAVAGMAIAANGADLKLTLINTVDLLSTQDPADASNIGSNPSTVAWNGTNAYVAGWNNGRGDGTNHGIVQIADAAGAATIGASFGNLPTLNFRGYLSLDVRGDRVLAGFENGGAAAQGLAQYDGNTGALINARTDRPVFANYDAGVQRSGVDAVSWSTFGSGRLRVHDQNDLSTFEYDGSNGPVIFAGSTIQRGQDIDTSGNIALGDGAGNISYFTRTGENSTSGGVIATTSGRSPFTGNGINVNILNTGFGDFIIYNDRGETVKDYANAVKLMGTDGTALTIDYDGGFDASVISSTAWYDFDYDVDSGTLAMVDFSNRTLHIFAVTPAPAGVAVMGLGGLAATRRRR